MDRSDATTDLLENDRFIVVTDVRTGEIVAADGRVGRSTGRSPADIARRALTWWVHPADRAAVREHHRRLRTHGRGALTVRIRHADGAWASYRIASSLRADRLTAAHCFIVEALDDSDIDTLGAATDRRRTEILEHVLDRVADDPNAYLAIVTPTGIETVDLGRSRDDPAANAICDD